VAGQSPAAATATPGPADVLGRLGFALTPITIAIAAALVSLALGIYEVTRANVLLGEAGTNLNYDQGVYFGVATRLADGIVPYRDFVYVHPPGIALLMLPIALLGRVIGSGTALAIAQCLTVCVVAANAFLAGYLVRSAGRVAVAVASVSLALWPFAVQVNGLVMLEPYLVLFSLLGALLLFGGDSPASRRRILLAGACLGMALSVKMWGALPVIAAIAWCLPAWRRRLTPLLGGIAAVVLVVWVPFVAMAPHAFVHDVIVAQIGRKPFIGIPETPLSAQLKTVIGFADIFGGPVITSSTVITGAAYAALALLVAAIFGLGWRSRSATDWGVLLFSLTAFLGMTAMPTPNYSTHYAYFPAALMAPLVGLCVGRTVSWIARRIGARRVAAVPVATALGSAAIVIAIVGIVLFIPKVTRATDLQVATAFDPRPAIQATIPAGACAVSDYPLALVVSDRFTSSTPGCPAVVDPFGMYLTDDNGNQPHLASAAHPIPAAFTDAWATWLGKADYVVLTVPYSDYIPWSPALMQQFASTFTLIDHATYPVAATGLPPSANLYIYRRSSG